MKALVLSALTLLGATSASAAGTPTPPEGIDRASHAAWVQAIGASVSAYDSFMFAWYQEQLTRPLPSQVNADPDKLFVTVERPLAQAVEKESNGEVDEGTSYGLETFGLINAPLPIVLETILFRWGKPVGVNEGVTYPYDTVYGYRQERLSPQWGPTSYYTVTTKRNGGIAKDMNDAFSFLVRGNDKAGYVLVGDFIEPTGPTATTSSISMIIIRPTSDGRTDYRVVGMQTGQSYSFVGIEQGRKNFGFNARKIRDGQKDFLSQVYSLRDTGKIPERKP